MDYNDVAEEIITLASDDYLLQDVPRWAKRLRLNKDDSIENHFIQCFTSRMEFRSVVNYRAKTLGNDSVVRLLSKMSHNKPNSLVSNLYISCPDIGPGMYIEHGFSTIIFAKKIGSDFHVNQSVTVGAGKGGCPVIGNNVNVHCNSVVIGGIEIGNHVVVAAGSIVVNSIPDNCTVASPKAVVISKG